MGARPGGTSRRLGRKRFLAEETGVPPHRLRPQQQAGLHQQGVSRNIRTVWEDAFPQLASRARAAA
ncbi:hypothetical protein AB0D35_10010 [Streptomyces sp. NPDC048301]|uniref:hypothetical protein n=1 Tax=Streptomyces sp. NPDC048301 TaxID=3155631 RepID=UPI003446EAB1